MNRANNLDSRFEKVQQDFFKELYGTKSQSARWKKCVDYVNGNMGIAVSALYVKTHFNAESKAKVSTKKFIICVIVVIIIMHEEVYAQKLSDFNFKS